VSKHGWVNISIEKMNPQRVIIIMMGAEGEETMEEVGEFPDASSPATN
jgi:hypothetical protein